MLRQKSLEKDIPAAQQSEYTTLGVKSSESIVPPQGAAVAVTATETPEVEYIRTVEVQGTLTGAYRDINNIQILSTGELAYKKSVFPKDDLIIEDGDVKEWFFIGGKEIPHKDTLTPVKEIGGKLTYLIDSASMSRKTLVFGNDSKAPDSYFERFEDIGGKLAYIYHKPDEQLERLVYDDKEIATADIYFTLLKDVGGALAYVKRSKSTEPSSYKETLFYDGQEIITTGTPKDVELVAGMLAYIVRDDTRNKDTLFYGDKQVETADAIWGLASINGKLMYQMKDDKGVSVLVEDGKQIAALGNRYTTRDVGGKLAYTFITAAPDKQSLQNKLIFDGVEVASSTFDAFLTAMAGETISDIEDVGGRLAYTIEGHESEDSFYYDGKKVLTAEIIGNSYQTVAVAGDYYTPYIAKSMKPFYFFGANEKDGMTTFSVYRITPK